MENNEKNNSVKTEQQINTAQELIDLVEKYIGDYYNKN